MEKILKQLNPWWFDKNTAKTKSIKRDFYLKNLKKLLKTKEIITISGIRRIGKSTIQKQLIEYLIFEKNVNPNNILFFNIDILSLKEKQENILNKIKDDYFKLNNPKGKIYIFLDEIQNLENWENYLKIEYDLNENIKFILTGSNSKLLYSNISKLLTGRVLNIHIHPISFKEYLEFKKFIYKDLDYNKFDLYNYFKNYIEFGNFPEIVLEKNKEINKQRVQEYLNSIILRDVLELNNIRESKPILELSRYLLSNTTKLFSYNKLANILGISKTTIKEYMMAFENAFLFEELLKFDYSLKKQILNEKKNYLLNLDFSNISFKFLEDKGRLLENLVFIELKRQNKEIYYHKEKQECDFVIKEGNKITQAIQVTKSLNNEETKTREIKGILEACKIYNLKTGLILTEDDEETIIQDNIKINIKPIWRWLLE